jgi:hypothetical protein
MNYDVVEAYTSEYLSINVTFRDGLTGKVKFLQSHLDGVFESLKNPDIFQKVSCKHGFVEWPGEIDLAPDAMYNEIKKNGIWELG